MDEPEPTRFSVRPENADAAIAHVTERGYPPRSVASGSDGLVHLTFAALPDDELYRLVQALPLHLSAMIGIVASSAEEFERLARNPLNAPDPPPQTSS